MKEIQHKSLILLMLNALIGCSLPPQKPERIDQLNEYFSNTQSLPEEKQIITNAGSKTLAILVSKSSNRNKRQFEEMLDNDQGSDNEFYASISNDLPQKGLVKFIIGALKSKFRQVDLVDSINEAKEGKYDYISVVEVLLQYADFWGQVQNSVEIRSIFLNSTLGKVIEASASGGNVGDSGHWGPPTQEGYSFYNLKMKVARAWVDELNKVVK
jgi:hypothetical protein